MLAQLARLLTGLLALAATLAGCQMIAPTPTPTPIPTPTVSTGELLLPQASPRCTDAFAGCSAERRPGAGLGAGAGRRADPVRLQPARREVPRGQRRHFLPWRQQGLPYQVSVVPSRAQATTTDAVQTLVCVRQTYIRVGFYQPNNTPAGQVGLGRPSHPLADRRAGGRHDLPWPGPAPGRRPEGVQPLHRGFEDLRDQVRWRAGRQRARLARRADRSLTPTSWRLVAGKL